MITATTKTISLTFVLIITSINQVISTPVTHIGTEHIQIIQNHLMQSQGSQKQLLVNAVDKTKLPLDTKTNARQKKGPSIPVGLPITHHLLVPTQLHVIPIHANIHHNSMHAGIISHTIQHPHSNVTHSTPLIPILIPIHHTHLVPIHDLSVIPLHRGIQHVETNKYRVAMEKKIVENEEPINQYRSFYGGFGNGLFFGGHGAGHGFYAYG